MMGTPISARRHFSDEVAAGILAHSCPSILSHETCIYFVFICFVVVELSVLHFDVLVCILPNCFLGREAIVRGTSSSVK